MIYFISDLHFNHDKEFVYVPRGFNCIEDMNNAIVTNWNNKVEDTDTVYIVGDVMLGDYTKGIELLKQLKGNIIIVAGNHDTDNRIKLYKQCENVIDVVFADRIRYDGCSIFISHFPTLCGNVDESQFQRHIFNVFGHTHSKDEFYLENPWMFNAACDANNCTPISIDEMLDKCEQKYKECKEFL